MTHVRRWLVVGGVACAVGLSGAMCSAAMRSQSVDDEIDAVGQLAFFTLLGGSAVFTGYVIEFGRPARRKPDDPGSRLAPAGPPGHTAGMGEHRTDYRLWAVSSGAAFLMTWLLVVGTALEARHLRSPVELLKEGWCVTLFLAVVAAAFGWFVQSVVVVQRDGARGGRPDPQAEDYDDTPPLS